MAGSIVDFVLGTILVALYASDRFNTPASNRSSTTAARYYTAVALYLGVATGIYAVLLFGFPQLAHQWAPSAIENLPWAKDLSAPLLVALLLTVSLPRVPILSNIDEWIRKKLQHMAAIPYEARRLSAALRKAPFHVADERQDEIRSGMLGEGFVAKDILFLDGSGPQPLWTKATALMKSLEDWEGHPRFSGFVANFATDLDALRGRYKQLVPKARNCFRLVRDHAAGRSDGQTDDAVTQFQADFVEQARELMRSMYDFFGRGVLQCKLTHGARCEQLRSLGFEVRLPRPKLTANELVALFMGLTVVLVFAFVARSSAGRAASLLELVGLAVRISAIYCVAIGWALYPKDRWQCARQGAGDIRPVACYMLSAVLASATGLAMSLMVKCLLSRDLAMVWEHICQVWPWTLMTFATAFATAWLTDNRPTPRWPASRLRWLEGLAQAALMVGVAWIVHILLRETGPQVPPLGDVLLRSGIIGFGIGFLVPTWHRDAPGAPEGEMDFGDESMARVVI
jgi:hypothetical protein